MGEACLAELLTFTRDGEWGQGEPSDGYVPMQVVRGTDFARVRFGNLTTLPVRYIREDIAERKQLQVGDVLLETAGGTKDQPTGRTVRITERTLDTAALPLACASFARFLRPDSKKIDSEYLFWKLQAEYASGQLLPFHIQHTGVARFQYTDFANSHSLNIPDRVSEQHRLVSVLTALDDKIELNRRMNETLEGIARAIFRDWFIDFGPTRAKQESASGGAATGKSQEARSGGAANEKENGAGREPYLAPNLWALFPDRLDDDGKPEGWRKAPIGELSDIVGGATPSTKNPEFWECGTHAWATPKDLSKREGLFLYETDRSITDAGLAAISSGLSPAGSVLLSSRAPIGYLAIAEQPTAVNQGFIVLRPTEDLPTAFAMFWCQSNLEMIKANANGSTFQEISKRNFRPLKVVAPDRATMNAFIGVVSPLLDRIRLNGRENHTLAATRDLLLPRLMSGEVRVAEAAALADEAVAGGRPQLEAGAPP